MGFTSLGPGVADSMRWLSVVSRLVCAVSGKGLKPGVVVVAGTRVLPEG